MVMRHCWRGISERRAGVTVSTPCGRNEPRGQPREVHGHGRRDPAHDQRL